MSSIQRDTHVVESSEYAGGVDSFPVARDERQVVDASFILVGGRVEPFNISLVLE
jgi:hypothetical protein